MGFRLRQCRSASGHATSDGESRWRRDGFDSAIHTLCGNSSVQSQRGNPPFHAKRVGTAGIVAFDSAFGWFAIRRQHGSERTAIGFAVRQSFECLRWR